MRRGTIRSILVLSQWLQTVDSLAQEGTPDQSLGAQQIEQRVLIQDSALSTPLPVPLLACTRCMPPTRTALGRGRPRGRL